MGAGSTPTGASRNDEPRSADRSGSEHVDHRARQLFALAGVGGLLLIATYIVMVRTEIGQQLGDEAFLGRKNANPTTKDATSAILHFVDVGTLVVMGVALLVFGVATRRFGIAVAAAAAFGGAVVTAEALKILLPRPALAALESELKSGGVNTFPSGHSTIATGFVLALIWVGTPRMRPWLAIGGATWASLMTSSTLAAGWHRPSDAVGGAALATLFVAGGAGIVVKRTGSQVEAPKSSSYILPGGLAIMVVAELAILSSLVSGRVTAEGKFASPYAFPLASVIIDATTVALICTFAWLMRDVRRNQGGHSSPTVGPPQAPSS